MPDPISDTAPTWFDDAIERLVQGEPLADFCAWFQRQALDDYAGATPRHARPPADDDRRFHLALARWLWSHVPVPDNRWRARPLAPPARNEPCYCGSGRKYKHCCLEFAGLQPPLDEATLLMLALAHADPSTLAPQALRQLPAEALGAAAWNWNESGDPERTIALIEPLFLESLDKLDGRHDLAFDALLDALLETGQDRRRKALAEHVRSSHDLELATSARCRLVSILSDNGDYRAAWALFEEARRLAPRDPQLWSLELTLLLGQGRNEEARMRGPLLAAQARKAGFAEGADMLLQLATEGLGSVRPPQADDTDEATADAQRAWLALAAALPQTSTAAEWQALYAPHEPAAAGGPPTHVIEPVKVLATVERRWHRHWSVTKPDLTSLWSPDADELLEHGDELLEFVARNPAAWLSFDILDDLLLAGAEWLAWSATQPVLAATQRIVDHALAGLRAVLGPDPVELPWGFMENRPALRLLAQGVELASARHDRATEERLQRWALALNPSDNQGWRYQLVPLLLGQSRFEEVLQLLQRFPDDAPPSEHNRALALFALGRKDEAEKVLRAAHAEYPRIMAALWPDVLDPPEPEDGFGMTIGGDGMAHDNRVDTRAAWLATGALEWARGLALKEPPARRSRPAPTQRGKTEAPPASPAQWAQSTRAPAFGATHEQRLRQHFDFPRLQGYVTAIVWTPQIVMPSHWLQGALALQAPGQEAAAPDIDALQRSLDTLMQLYNRLNVDLLRTRPDQKAPLALLHKLLAAEPGAATTWAAGFIEGAEVTRGAWRNARRPIAPDKGAFGTLYQLAAQAPASASGWPASSRQDQPLLVGLEASVPQPAVQLVLALQDLWQAIGPLRHATAQR